MNKILTCIMLTCVLFGCSKSPVDDSNIKQDLEEILMQQKIAWNQGDISEFMSYYWNSEELTFQTGDHRLCGWQTLMNRYNQNYPEENRGFLKFLDIAINVLSPNTALVLGRWNLTLKGESKGGLFTLVFRKMPEGWRIIHDHTS